jgi:putative membrane protein
MSSQIVPNVVPTIPWHEHFWGLMVSAGVFGLLGIVLLLLGYFLFDFITPRIDVQKELTEKNMAVATVVAALLLGIAYIVAHVVAG